MGIMSSRVKAKGNGIEGESDYIYEFKYLGKCNVNANPWHDSSREPRPTELVAACDSTGDTWLA